MVMDRYILVPDSFKGTMSSVQVCEIMADQIRKHRPDAEIRKIPVADGGEGSTDCFLLTLGGEKRPMRVTGPFLGEQADGFFGLTPCGSGIVEVAACASLPQVEGRANPLLTTTYGVGELMLGAARAGAKRIILGLGGSATNDGGCGAATACGVRFYDDAGITFTPTGGTLNRIARIDTSELDPALRAFPVTAMCDIDNPLCGPTGAAWVFGPQKGADDACVAVLDQGLAHLAALIRRDLGMDAMDVPGAGAAGGFGAGALAFFGARLQLGIDVVLDAVGFDALAKGATLVLTGEGRIDDQSLRGKVAIGVARRAKAVGTPAIAIVGDIEDPIDAAYDQGLNAILSINRVAKPYSDVRHRSTEDLAKTVDTLMRLLSIGG